MTSYGRFGQAPRPAKTRRTDMKVHSLVSPLDISTPASASLQALRWNLRATPNMMLAWCRHDASRWDRKCTSFAANTYIKLQCVCVFWIGLTRWVPTVGHHWIYLTSSNCGYIWYSRNNRAYYLILNGCSRVTILPLEAVACSFPETVAKPFPRSCASPADNCRCIFHGIKNV